MSQNDTPIELIRAQRNSVAAAYHDLQVEHTLLKTALQDTLEKLAAAEQRIAALEAQEGYGRAA